MNTLQTLDRGLLALESVARHPSGISIADLAAELGIHRAICYRLVTTLQAHGLVCRTAAGAIRLGAGIGRLAERYEPALRHAAEPILRRLADVTHASSFVSIQEGDECVVAIVVEPVDDVIRVGYRVGTRHSLKRGAAGIAILASRPERSDDMDAVRRARRDGYSLTRGELENGAVGVAAPIVWASGIHASVGVVAIDGLDTERAAAAVKAAVRDLAAVAVA